MSKGAKKLLRSFRAAMVADLNERGALIEAMSANADAINNSKEARQQLRLLVQAENRHMAERHELIDRINRIIQATGGISEAISGQLGELVKIQEDQISAANLQAMLYMSMDDLTDEHPELAGQLWQALSASKRAAPGGLAKLSDIEFYAISEMVDAEIERRGNL